MKLRPLVLALTLALPGLALAGPMAPPEGYDSTALHGDWFEVAATPTILEHDCRGTTVTVSPRSQDSRLELKIACHKGSPDGKVLPIEGIMVETTPGAFEVRFVHLMQLGNLALVVLWQSEDGSMAVLGSPTGDVGWVWSREQHPDRAALEAAKAVLAAAGYNPQYIADVDQGK